MKNMLAYLVVSGLEIPLAFHLDYFEIVADVGQVAGSHPSTVKKEESVTNIVIYISHLIWGQM